MSCSPTSFSRLPFLFFLLISISISSFHLAQASVPAKNTFKYVNEGEFGPYINEYNADYRSIPIFASPFQLFFYNTTPNAYTLALRMGIQRTEPIYRWVWEANRGKPVGENATLTFGTDGNLVLAHADGRVAWQTGTAGKGVVGLKLHSNGNLVLYDSKGKFVWQSFDYPTDTLLVGQSLKVGYVTKLVSRASESENVDGKYSLVMEAKRLALYYKSSNSPKPMIYASVWFNIDKGVLQNVTLEGTPDDYSGYAYYLNMNYHLSGVEYPNGGRILVRPKYNSSQTFLRLGMDGNIRLYTYFDKVDWGGWEVTYTLFDSDAGDEERSECHLPERCGKFGLCHNSQCVACPSPKGLMGWSEECAPLKLSGCGVKDFHYYKLDGVDHFMSKYSKGDGPMKQTQCSEKCTKDCKCLGYFYNTLTSRCLIAYDLKTLTKVQNSTHLAYIKAPNK